MGLKLIMIMLAFTYFTAGVSKLRYGGMRWLDGKTLTQSIGTVLPELSGFVLLIPGWPRLLYLLSAIAMHVTIYLLMNLPFFKYELLCIILIDWRWLLGKLQRPEKGWTIPGLTLLAQRKV